ncbi:OLC1v1008448C1 [Oldenlandia corymbosa var. corymbosa]|uniref:OLC1v1008448C1 n=1 Tax=Oldenlandia corymbosa var. corymbosa TaxID=529605 RepID=A0AAV1DLM5_OLDCO|nr:OLC1v1008448C1 [Oldenlandia corymbosa var. corymbosa]
MSIWKKYMKADQKEMKSLELIFIDAQGGKIQATIPKSFMDTFIKYFKEGCVLQIACFDHALNIVGGYRCSKHEYKIVFEPNTIVDIVDAVVDLDIPNHVFKFTPFAEISNFIANFDFCFDVIGHVIGVSEPIIDGEKKRIFVDLEDERLKITLWNGNVDVISAMMADHPVMPVVLIVQYVKCKKWNCSKAIVVDGSGSGIVTFWDRQVYNLINKTASELLEEEPGVYYPNKLDELKGKKCLFKLDVSHFNIRNRDSEMSITRVTTDAAIIKQYLHVSEDLETDAETSIEFGLNMTQTDDSTAKEIRQNETYTAVSCTGDVNIQNADDGTPLEDTDDSPPPKKTKSTQDPESVKSHQNKCVRKI